jgi:hypothetical protein
MTAAVCILAASAQKKNIHDHADQGAQRKGGAAHHGVSVAAAKITGRQKGLAFLK